MITNKCIGDVSMPNCKVTLGVSPENLVPSPIGFLTIKINNTEPFGANTVLHGHLKQSEQKITVSLPGVHELNKIEREISFMVNRENIHLFCSTNGKRL